MARTKTSTTTELDEKEIAGMLNADDVTETEDLEAEIEAEAAESAEAPAEASDEGETEAPKRKRISTAGMRPSQIISEKIGDQIYEVAIISTGDTELTDRKLKNQINKMLEGMDELPKKVGEKVVNAFNHLANGVNLSVYTRDAVALLVDKGSVTTDDIKGMYLDHPYSPGTASAQSSQMMAVLPFLGIATREGKTLTLCDDSVLATMLANPEAPEADAA